MKLYLSLLPGDNNDQLHQMNEIGSSEEVVGTREGGETPSHSVFGLRNTVTFNINRHNI